jgi:ABC-type nitrate/sulfonate/bicarbonate transport system, permease component
MRLKAIAEKFYPLLAVGVFLLLWLAAAKIVGLEMILPTPAAAIKKFFFLLSAPVFWNSAAHTLLRTLIAFSFSFLAALIFSVLSYVFKPISKLLAPLVSVVRSVPTMSIILISIIWFKRDTSPIFITSLIVFPLLYAAFYGALNGIDKGLLDMSAAFKVPLKTRLGGLYILSIARPVLTAVKSNISLSVKITISAEVLAQTRASMGLGMQNARVYLDTAELLGWTVAAVLISAGLELLVEIISRFALRSRERGAGSRYEY